MQDCSKGFIRRLFYGVIDYSVTNIGILGLVFLKYSLLNFDRFLGIGFLIFYTPLPTQAFVFGLSDLCNDPVAVAPVLVHACFYDIVFLWLGALLRVNCIGKFR